MKLASIAKYLYEIGHLKHVKRSGWWRMGVRDPESVAEHSYRTAVIGYVLADLEGADPEKTASICLFHDTAEARIGDLHWVTKHYLTSNPSINIVLKEASTEVKRKNHPYSRSCKGGFFMPNSCSI